MTTMKNQVGWYCGLQGPFAHKAQALAMRKTAAVIGYKPVQTESISYRVDKNLWKSPNILVEK